MGTVGEEEWTISEAEMNVFKQNSKGVKALMESGITRIPNAYVKPLDERPTKLAAAEADYLSGNEIEIPVINFAGFDGEGHAQVVKSIGEACEKWGFFQVINHGVPTSVIHSVMQVCEEFFDLPVDEKMELYSDDTLKPVRFGTSVNLSKDTVLEWRDYLRCPCRPLSDFIHLWPAKPSTFRELTTEYCEEIAALAKRLCCAISESLGLEFEYLYEVIGKHQQVIMANHYPACPNPDLTIGVSPHSDPGGITILLQDQVGGLEVFNEGRWIAVKPLPNAFVVNLGDQIQFLTNGRYKSVEHRATVNAEKARISIPTFFSPQANAKIAPIPELLGGQPPMYIESIFGVYLQRYFTNKLNRKSAVDSVQHAP
ncbi:hypothetical protein O6H91_06G012400 [Diphasiastrum complanatum]|uniref:Uncharacterized protein n=1 Tax=Diphasiastrum complanatum TaxID=34168 RepID=A0ACC2DB00_DIPCM|nr:hypothetical protein O6H91_06G012400 [Diphasiastrum complanatum]